MYKYNSDPKCANFNCFCVSHANQVHNKTTTHRKYDPCSCALEAICFDRKNITVWQGVNQPLTTMIKSECSKSSIFFQVKHWCKRAIKTNIQQNSLNLTNTPCYEYIIFALILYLVWGAFKKRLDLIIGVYGVILQNKSNFPIY